MTLRERVNSIYETIKDQATRPINYLLVGGAFVTIFGGGAMNKADAYTFQFRKLTDDAAIQAFPDISYMNVVWQDNRDGSQQVYHFNLDTETESRFTTNNEDHYSPIVFGHIVTWDDRRDNPAMPRPYLKDLDTGIERDVMEGLPGYFVEPRVWDEFVVTSTYTLPGQIHLLNLITKVITPTGIQTSGGPGISEGYAIYTRSGFLHILDVNTLQETTLTDSVKQHFISMDNGRILYHKTEEEIYSYDINLTTDTHLTPTTNDVGHLDIHKDFAVWVTYGASDKDIALHNFSNGITTVIERAGDQTNPKIWGNRIVCVENNDVLMITFTDGSEPLCSNGLDDDGDNLVDYYDPGCYSDGVYDPNDNDESEIFQCNDWLDNDGDGLVDYPDDPGCSGPLDNDETTPVTVTQCSDGIDNDGDGKIDYFDRGCYRQGLYDPTKNCETSAPCNNGIDDDGDGVIDNKDRNCYDSEGFYSPDLEESASQVPVKGSGLIGLLGLFGIKCLRRKKDEA